MSSKALREKLKIIFTKTTFSMLHVMSCFPPQEALTFFKIQFQKCECVSDKSCVKGTDPLSAHNDNLNCIEKFHYAPRTLAAASTSIHSISIHNSGKGRLRGVIFHSTSRKSSDYVKVKTQECLKMPQNDFRHLSAMLLFSKACKIPYFVGYITWYIHTNQFMWVFSHLSQAGVAVDPVTKKPSMDWKRFHLVDTAQL